MKKGDIFIPKIFHSIFTILSPKPINSSTIWIILVINLCVYPLLIEIVDYIILKGIILVLHAI